MRWQLVPPKLIYKFSVWITTYLHDPEFGPKSKYGILKYSGWQSDMQIWYLCNCCTYPTQCNQSFYHFGAEMQNEIEFYKNFLFSKAKFFIGFYCEIKIYNCEIKIYNDAWCHPPYNQYFVHLIILLSIGYWFVIS